jgi:hypothetical protein
MVRTAQQCDKEDISKISLLMSQWTTVLQRRASVTRRRKVYYCPDPRKPRLFRMDGSEDRKVRKNVINSDFVDEVDLKTCDAAHPDLRSDQVTYNCTH